MPYSICVMWFHFCDRVLVMIGLYCSERPWRSSALLSQKTCFQSFGSEWAGQFLLCQVLLMQGGYISLTACIFPPFVQVIDSCHRTRMMITLFHFLPSLFSWVGSATDCVTCDVFWIFFPLWQMKRLLPTCRRCHEKCPFRWSNINWPEEQEWPVWGEMFYSNRLGDLWKASCATVVCYLRPLDSVCR